MGWTARPQSLAGGLLCDTPGRRAGLAQVYLDNLDDASTEVAWAKRAGFMGVLCPMTMC